MKPIHVRPSLGSPRAAFSLIEVSISLALMMMIALSVLPMFTRSMAAANNGREKTEVTTFLHVADEMLTLPLGKGQIAPATGAITRQLDHFWCQGDEGVVADLDEGWFADPDGKGLVLWDRRTVTRQFSVRALDPNADGLSELLDAEAIPGGERPENVHWTITDVLLDGRREAGPLGPGVLMSARQIRAF